MRGRPPRPREKKELLRTTALAALLNLEIEKRHARSESTTGHRAAGKNSHEFVEIWQLCHESAFFQLTSCAQLVVHEKNVPKWWKRRRDRNRVQT